MRITAPERASERPENNPPLRLQYHKPVRVLHGGMSLVYLCDVEDFGDDTAAVKKLSTQLAQIPGASERFLRECHMWLLLPEHPNVVTARSAHRGFGDAPCIVLECLPHSLRHLLDRSPLDHRRSITLMLQVLDGLLHIRTYLTGFVHADLKPENILIDNAGVAKITDLGLSRIASSPGLGHTAPSAGTPAQTSVGWSGTPLYMAPEQIHGRALTEQSDIYGLACVVFEALTGRPVYGSPTTVEDYLLRHQYAQAPSLLGLKPDVPVRFADRVHACLAKDPADRPTLASLRADLVTIADAEGIPYSTPSGEPLTEERIAACAQGLINLELPGDALALMDRAQQPAVPITKDASASLLLIAAGAYVRTGQLRQAEEKLNQAEQLIFQKRNGSRAGSKVNEAYYCNERGNLAAATGDLESCHRWATRTIELLPESSVSWASLSRAQNATGRTADAISSMEKAVSIAGNPRYYYALIGLLLLEGEDGRAAEWARDFRDFHPDHPWARAIHAFVLARQLLAGKIPVSEEAVGIMVADYNVAARSAEPPKIMPELRRLIDMVVAMLQRRTT